MREAKTFTSIKKVNYLLASISMLGFLLPVYGDDSTQSNDTKSKSSEIATSNIDDANPAESNSAKPKEKESKSPENKSTELKLPEVKVKLPDSEGKNASDSKDTATLAGNKKSSKSFKKKSSKKAANEAMSSDDTTQAYTRSIDPNLHFEKARQLASQNQYNAALKEINQALAQEPKFYEARYLGALIYYKQDRKLDAAKKLKDLLLYKPEYLQARISYGMVLADLGQIKGAEFEYKKAIETCFSSVEAHYDLANLLTMQSRFPEALQELRICLKLAPDNAAAHNNLGVIYYHQHHVEQSEKEFKQASELDPANKTYVHNLELVRAGDNATEDPSLG